VSWPTGVANAQRRSDAIRLPRTRARATEVRWREGMARISLGDRVARSPHDFVPEYLNEVNP